MISDITGIEYEILKDNIVLDTNELPISTMNEKAKRCDFILRISDNNVINLELNAHSYSGRKLKNLAYIFGIFNNTIKRGNKHDDNLVITQTNIDCFKNKTSESPPLSKIKLADIETGEVYIENLVIYTLNVVKCHELYYNDDIEKQKKYIKWGALIYSSTKKEIESIAKELMNSQERKKIMSDLSKLTHEDLFYTEEEALEWAEWERNSIADEARKEGLEEGIEQGIEQGIENNTKDTIISMIKNKATLEFISKVTGKSIKEIENIIKEN